MKKDKYFDKRIMGVYMHVGRTRKSKTPRRFKKILIGRKANKRKLKLMLANVQVIEAKEPGYGSADIIPYEFCPMCGCDATNSSGEMASYPETYVKYTCARCGFLVGGADNSPFYHCLEFPEDGYIIP